jgi:hypothetical protein
MNNTTPSDDFLEEYSQTSLPPVSEEELAEFREYWEKSRQDELEHMKNNEYWNFLVSEWWEQGCGRMIMLFMTQKPEDKAIEKFKELFGEYFTEDLHFVTREEFFTKYSQYLPPKLVELKDQLCYIEYHSKLQFSFS